MHCIIFNIKRYSHVCLSVRCLLIREVCEVGKVKRNVRYGATLLPAEMFTTFCLFRETAGAEKPAGASGTIIVVTGNDIKRGCLKKPQSCHMERSRHVNRTEVYFFRISCTTFVSVVAGSAAARLCSTGQKVLLFRQLPPLYFFTATSCRRPRRRRCCHRRNRQSRRRRLLQSHPHPSRCPFRSRRR